jgi:hypothetical protein
LTLVLRTPMVWAMSLILGKPVVWAMSVATACRIVVFVAVGCAVYRKEVLYDVTFSTESMAHFPATPIFKRLVAKFSANSQC